jgi:hypothetical protein
MDANTPEYDPDCQACLRGRTHTAAEHEAALRRARLEPCDYCDAIESMTGVRQCPIHA